MNFRLILDGAALGAENMARDEAILLANARDFGFPTLRFYSWEPFCVSLGRLQKILPPDMSKKLENGEWVCGRDVVRRLTGGRAVWHAREITYSICAPLEILPPNLQSVNGAYDWLSRGFLRGLQNLGLPVEMAPTGAQSEGANCFAASASCDFLANGKKLIGAAQCRVEGAFLQHGSLLLEIDEKWPNRAGGEMKNAISLRELDLSVEKSQILEALCEGFATHTGAKLENGVTNARESELAKELEGKYRSLKWTLAPKNWDVKCA